MMYVFSKQDAHKYEEVVGHLKTIFTGGAGASGQTKSAAPVPFDLPINTALMVTIALSENELWTALSLQGLVSAYSDNEPDYSLDDIKQ